jgi:hypothetical protein
MKYLGTSGIATHSSSEELLCGMMRKAQLVQAFLHLFCSQLGCIIGVQYHPLKSIRREGGDRDKTTSWDRICLSHRGLEFAKMQQ